MHGMLDDQRWDLGAPLGTLFPAKVSWMVVPTNWDWNVMNSWINNQCPNVQFILLGSLRMLSCLYPSILQV